MEYLTIELQEETTEQEQPCSEEKCATCFENRGCMFERYLATIRKIEEQFAMDNRQ